MWIARYQLSILNYQLPFFVLFSIPLSVILPIMVNTLLPMTV